MFKLAQDRTLPVNEDIFLLIGCADFSSDHGNYKCELHFPCVLARVLYLMLY